MHARDARLKQLVVDGRLDSVSLYSAGPTADFPELDTQEWREDDHDQQGNLLDPIKVKEGRKKRGNRLSVEAEALWLRSRKRMRGTARPTLLTEMGSEEQGSKGQSTTGCERIKKAKSDDEKLEPSDVFSAMPPVESFHHAMVSYVMTERVDLDETRCLQCSTCQEHTFTVCERDVHVEPPSELHRPGQDSESEIQCNRGRNH